MEASSPGEGLSQTPPGLGGISNREGERERERDSSYPYNLFVSMSFPDGHIQTRDG